MSEDRRQDEGKIDYDLHGLLGIRLIDATEGDARAVARQLGPLRGTLSGEPDVTIRFVAEMPIPDLHYLGLSKVGHDTDNFYILRSSKRDARVKVDFSQIGGKVEIVCERGLKSVPGLLAIINLSLLKKSIVGLHASAFNYEGQGIIVTGWAKGGKTEALLSFAAHGAEYIGDEWIFLSADGQNIYGIPENIRLWDWHLDNLPHLKSYLSSDKKVLFRGVHFLDRVEQKLPTGGVGKSFPVKFLREAMPAFKRQLNVQLPPDVIFNSCAKSFSGKPDKIFLLTSHAKPAYEVVAMEPADIARQMVASLQFEMMPFMESYYAFKFAFPEKANYFIEHAAGLQLELLLQALSGLEGYAVKHPYPLAFDALYQVMQPYCSNPRNGEHSDSVAQSVLAETT